ncbi:phage portal protein [Rhodoplanes elegans]|nr:phage portal protein [Rhodoplanes elegans]
MAAPTMATAISWAELLGLPVAPGTVTSGDALRVPAYAGSVRLISEALSVLPARIIKVSDAGEREHVRGDRRARLLDRPCSWLSWSEFVAGLTIDAMQRGHAFALATRGPDGEIRELLPLGAACTVDQAAPTEPPVYRISLADGTNEVHTRADILHIRCFDGRAMPEVLAGPLSLSLSLMRHVENLFRRGAKPGGYLKPKKQLSEDAKKNLKKAFDAAASGPENAGRTLLLEPDVDFDPAVMTSVDAELTGVWERATLEIARGMRVSPHQIAEQQKAPSGNAETMGAEFVRYCLLPWIRMWEGALEIVLFGPDEWPFEVEFDATEFERAEFASRFEGLAKAVTHGILNPNEARSTIGMPPYQGGEKYVMQGANVPVSALGAPPAAAPQPPAGGAQQ